MQSQAIHSIRSAGQRLDLSTTSIHRSQYLFERAMGTGKWKFGRQADDVAAACIVLAARETGNGKSLAAISVRLWASSWRGGPLPHTHTSPLMRPCLVLECNQCGHEET